MDEIQRLLTQKFPGQSGSLLFPERGRGGGGTHSIHDRRVQHTCILGGLKIYTLDIFFFGGGGQEICHIFF